ncbi:MAG: protein kinase family protein [Cyanobacteria bacterium SZAS LIN-2]|nr:protein kinase family protein [Cyanobacteria bacterium SZAS LIN-2]
MSSQFSDRLALFARLSERLAGLPGAELDGLLEQSRGLHAGIGGVSSLLDFDGTQIFVKRIPLTDLESMPENIKCTSNIFDLPLYYQYRLGSYGFGAWRELAAHEMTTGWVLSGQCEYFPLMYHWRVVEAAPASGLTRTIDEETEYWAGSAAVRKRLESLNEASACLEIFLEYVPQNLDQWFSLQCQNRPQSLAAAIESIDAQLTNLTDFMRERGFVHFDCHFGNILCDGEIYLSDFGLALAKDFVLSEAESEFLNRHSTYDRCVAFSGLVRILRDYQMSGGTPGESILPLLDRYAPAADALHRFYKDLQDSQSKSTDYPESQLARLLFADNSF